MLYTSSSASLAALEILANSSALPRDYILTQVSVPDGLIEHLPLDQLPANWDAAVPIEKTKDLGRQWALELRSAVLSVPSSIIPVERNFIINPIHPDFESIHFEWSVPFRFDTRLKNSG